MKRLACLNESLSWFYLIRCITIYRGVQTQSLPPSAASDILNSQRLKRPSSPHFTIYQPQLTWLGSIANRVTGAGLSACASSFLSPNSLSYL